jgi:succinyl-CoA synthetase beta subunit
MRQSNGFKRATKIFGISTTKRLFSLHEYQSHQLFQKYGIQVPKGIVASTVEEAVSAAEKIGGGDYVVKAQVLAGGRGKGTFTNGFKGGVHKAYSVQEVKDLASQMLGQTLVTAQTGSKGKPVSKVFIQERVYSRRELYFAILLDRQSQGPVLVGSTSGGVSIEDVARETPEAIIKHPVNYLKGLSFDEAENFAKRLGFGQLSAQAADQIVRLYEMFCKSDATLVEVNPMIETPKNGVICADAKVNIDDNADFRHDDLIKLKDDSQEDYRDVQASKFGLNYIGLDGNIGCIVNGAGLAMATMDIIKLYGGEPANFLDVGGGATQDQIVEAFKLLNSDKQVQAILVNIFGGIMKCDVFAYGLINAANKVGLRAPLVVRLQGTNVSQARKIMEDSPVRIIHAENLDDAAKKAVQVANIVESAKKINLKVNFELPI